MHSFIAGILNIVCLVDVDIIFFSIRQTVVKNGRQIYNYCLSETANVFLKQLKIQLDSCIIKWGLQQVSFVGFLNSFDNLWINIFYFCCNNEDIAML